MDNILIRLLASTIAIYFIFISTYITLARRNLRFRNTPLSYYVFERGGAYLTLGFILIFINQTIISYLLLLDGFNISSLLMFISAIGILTLGVFKSRKRKCLSRNIHEVGASVFFIFFQISLTCIFVATGSYIFHLFFTVSIALSLIPLGIIHFMNRKKVDIKKNHGVTQRVAIILINVWLILAPLII